MKTRLIILLLTFSCIAFGCRRSSVTIIKEMGTGLTYSSLNDVGRGVRVISADLSLDKITTQIVIPGDVLWCDLRGDLIIGEKASYPPPADWMDPNWKRSGFFILKPTSMDLTESTDAERIGRAVSWFQTREEMEKKLESMP